MKAGVGREHQRWGQGAAAGSLFPWGSATQDAEGYGIGTRDAFIGVGVQVQIQNNSTYCYSPLHSSNSKSLT